MSKLKIILAVGVSLIVAFYVCFAWIQRNSKTSSLEILQKVRRIMSAQFSLELSNSWQIVNADGGEANPSVLAARSSREFYLQYEGNFVDFENLHRELAPRAKKIGFTFFSPEDEYKKVVPHESSAQLAPWWQPETNSEPMMFAKTAEASILYIYGFKKSTNALIYIHIIQP